MAQSCGRSVISTYSCKSSIDSPKIIATSVSSEAGPSIRKFHKPSAWSGYLVPVFSALETLVEVKGTSKVSSRITYWVTATLKRVINSGSMRRILGINKTAVSSSKSDIWLLGLCYKFPQDGLSDPSQSEGYASFLEDFLSRILITYRKGFPPIEDTKYSSDVNWGCMIRSSQMLVAQALIFHILGRTWRKTVEKPMDHNYIDILNLFTDSDVAPYSIHNLLKSGRSYGLSPGSWVGPYAMCRAWETLARSKRKDSANEGLTSMISLYVVSGDEDGERGGAPVVCVEDITRHCLEFSKGQRDWVPTVLLVPLVLGLEKLNPRYLPLIGATFCFPQSLGIMGGRPGASTYIIGVQDDKAFYLDPHEVQPVVDISKDNLEAADTSSYHSNTVRHFPLDSLDPSLAIGFYCKDKSDFDDFCLRASKLAEQSNGAPLFTVTQTRNSQYTRGPHKNVNSDTAFPEPDSSESVANGERDGCTQEDDWQLL